MFCDLVIVSQDFSDEFEGGGLICLKRRFFLGLCFVICLCRFLGRRHQSRGDALQVQLPGSGRRRQEAQVPAQQRYVSQQCSQVPSGSQRKIVLLLRGSWEMTESRRCRRLCAAAMPLGDGYVLGSITGADDTCRNPLS